MGSVEWLLVGIGPIALLIVLFLLLLKRLQHRRKNLAESINQLSHRLHKRLSTLQAEQDQESNSISKEILEILQESEEQCRASESSVLSSSLSSILPVKESIAALSKRLFAMAPERVSLNDSQSLNLTSLAVVYVRSHMDEVIRVEHIANELSVTPDQLYVCVKESLGCSVQELITVIKMQEAKRLLASGNLLVKNVANQLGFWSPYHFSSRFKLFFGLSPKQYKKRVQERRRRKASKTDPDYRLNAQKKINKQKDAQYQAEKVNDKKSERTQDLSPGTVVDRFLIVNRIGHGGMGVVYKAYDPKLNRGVALKLIRADHAKSEQLQHRLLREAQALARLSHPNVLHVYDVGTYGDQIFMTMALIEGQTLKEWLVDEKRSIKEILKVMIAAGRGLSAAHKAGLVHRDFKPSNVIVGDDGQVRVLDFGLARTTSIQGGHQEVEGLPQEVGFAENIRELSPGESTDMLLTPLTHAGKILGTPMYMAPEQLLGLATDERTDQFGFCVVLYEALYGKRPFLATTMEKLKSEVMRQQVFVPRADTDVPAWLWPVVYRGLSAKPEDRYPTIHSLLEDLDKDPEELRQQKRLTRLRKLLLTSMIVLTIALPVGVWYGLRFRTFQLCKAAEGEFDGVWDETTKAATRKAFLATKKIFATETWQRVERILDAQLADWKQMRSEICEAKILRATLSEKLFDLRMSCLRKRMRDLNALTGVLRNADSEVLQKAVPASTSLESVAICADEESLRAPYPPPNTAEAKTKVASIQNRLADVDALIKTGKYRDGFRLAKTLNKAAETIDFRPVRAEVLARLGLLFEQLGEYKKAETILIDAANLAGESKDAKLAAKMMASLVRVIGYKQSRFEDSISLSRYATVVLGLAGPDEITRAELISNLGIVFAQQNNYDKALSNFGKALSIYEKKLGPEHTKVANTLNRMGIVFRRQGRYQKALEYYEKILKIYKKSLGASHPLQANTLNNMGLVYWNQGDYKKALKKYHKAISIYENALGPEHPDVARSLSNIGILFEYQGKYESALEYHRKALAIREKTLGSEHPDVATVLDNMGIVFKGQREYNKALAYFRRSLEIREKALAPRHPSVAQTLTYIGTVFVEQARYQEAREPLEQALDICKNMNCEQDSYGQALFGLAQSLAASNGDKESAIALATQAREIYDSKPKRFTKEIREVNAWLKKHAAGEIGKMVTNRVR